MRQAVGALRAVLAAGVLPSALEVADQFTLAAARERTGSDLLSGCGALLIVELDGQRASVRSEIRQLRGLLARHGPLTESVGWGEKGCERFWRLRREFSYALRDTGLTKLNEDVTVPRGRLEDLFRFTARLQSRYGIQVACFGHAGDGNIHVNLMVDYGRPGMRRVSVEALDALFRQVVAWGGAITGEHGIGLAKKRWWPLAVGPAERRLHERIRAALDPDRVLNPGKFV
jgi:glycolate oxidase